MKSRDERFRGNGLSRAAGAALVASAALAVGATPMDTVWEAQKARAAVTMPANAERVKADLAAAGLAASPVAFYAVPAMSDVMRTPDVYPIDGRIGGEVRATLAQGEFESASFELFAFKNFTSVELKVSDLKGPGGATLAADLRVVKCWFQNGNAWVSYFDDVGLKLVPELLLHDEHLIEVNTEKVANYARVMRNGKATKVWISAPKGLDANSFDPYDPGFRDAETIQPVALERDAFKQFFLTCHAAKGQKPGVYRGAIALRAGGAKLGEIPVAVRVLPFELPMPRGYQNYDQLYFYSCMGAMPSRERMVLLCGNDRARGERSFRNWMQSLYDHSVFHAPYIDAGNVDCLPLLKEIGFPLNPLTGNLMVPWFGLNFGGRMSFQQLMSAKYGAEKCKAFYDAYVPGSQILVGHGDEQGTAFVTTHREFYQYFNEKGIKVGCAGHDALMIKGGYAFGYYPMGGEPDNLEKARAWHELGNEPVGFYASQHTGSENPQFVRMQHGMLGYLSGLTMTYNYEFAIGSWNDRVNELYKPMAITYSCGDGLMETIQYAGFREGCDDIRYATYLKGLAREADAHGTIKAQIAARKALHYLALLKRDKMDLNAVRAEMIEHILKIRKELGK